jgi:ASC-1-like (ASCH) protein
MSVQMQAIQKAVQFLNAAGATYKILGPGGENLYDTIPAPAAPAKTKRVYVNNHVRITDYRNKLKEMKAGDVVTFNRMDYPAYVPDDKKAWRSFCSSFMGACKEQFGPDNFVVEGVTNQSITVLRVA